MAITFFHQSRKDTVPIWVRYTDSYSDAKTRTPLYITKDRLVKNNIIKYKVGRSLSTNKRNIVHDRNKALDNLKVKMDDIERLIIDAVNSLQGRTVITSEWLKMVVNQTNRLFLKDHIQNWIDSKVDWSDNSRKSAEQFQRFMAKHFDVQFEDLENRSRPQVALEDINLIYFDKLKTYCKEKGMMPRTINQRIGYLCEVCEFAEDRGYKINFRKSKVERIKEAKAIKSYLNIDELKTIIDLEINYTGNPTNEELEISRDWLILSCYTAMRSSDMYNLNNSNIVGDRIVYRQQKTDSKDVSIDIFKPVEAILKRFNGFPPINRKYSKRAWVQRYQRHIQTICKLAGINEMVKSKNGDTEKYNTITTHIGRMSFATNHYEILPTVHIMGITGHSSESQLLTYINKERVQMVGNSIKDTVNALSGY